MHTIDDTGSYAIRKTQHAVHSRLIPHSSVRAWARSHLPALISLLAVAALYLGALVSMPPEGFTQHDTGAKYLQVRNLRLTPTGIDWSINYPARPLDPNLQFVPFNPKQHEVDAEGRIYLQWPIFLGLLTRIPWKVLGFWGLYLVPLLAGLGTLWASYLLALNIGGVPRKAAWLAIPLVGLATPISIYSLLYFEHTLAAMLVTFSLLAALLAMRGDESSRRGLIFSGALLAVAVYFRSELYVLAFVMVCLYVADGLRSRSWRPLLIWGGAFLVSLVPLWAFYAINEGSILPLHAMWYFAGGDGSSAPGTGGIELPRLRYIADAGLRILPDFLLGPQDAQIAPLSPTFPPWAEISTLAGTALCALSAFGIFTRRLLSARWPLYTLGAGLLLILAPSLLTLVSEASYYNLHGFLLASPFIVLALLPARSPSTDSLPATDDTQYVIRNRFSRLQVMTLLYVGLHALVISALSGLGPISRHEWGQRYLLPAYPALAVLALAGGWRLWSGGMTNTETRASRPRQLVVQACLALGVLLALIGAGFTLRGYFTLADERAQVVAWQGLARTLPDREPLLTDTWWLPLNLAADFYTRPIMLAEGAERMAEWAREMRGRKVQTFGLMSPDREVLSGPWAEAAGYTRAGSPQESRGMWLQRYTLNPGP